MLVRQNIDKPVGYIVKKAMSVTRPIPFISLSSVSHTQYINISSCYSYQLSINLLVYKM